MLNSIPEHATKLAISNQNISDLSFISKLHNLEELICHNNPIHILPRLPKNLKVLVAYNTFIKEFPNLPQDCKLERIFLPDTIEYIPENLETLDTGSCMGWPEGKFRRSILRPEVILRKNKTASIH